MDTQNYVSPEEGHDGFSLKLPAVIFLMLVYALSASFAVLDAGYIMIIALLICSVSGALLLCFYPSPFLIITPAAAYALGFLFCGSPARAALTLIAVPVVLTLSYSVKTRRSCTGAVVRVSAVMALLAASGIVAYILYDTHAISFNIIKNAAVELYDYLSSYILTTFVYEVDGETVSYITSEGAHSLARYLIAAIPGLIITCANIFAFIVAKLFARACRALGFENALSDKYWIFDMSLISASVFIIVTVMSLLLGSFSGAEPVYYAAVNLQIILSPGLAVIGLRTIILRLMRRMSRGSLIIMSALIIFACLYAIQFVASLLSVALMLLSAAGAVSVIKRKAPKLKSRNDKE